MASWVTLAVLATYTLYLTIICIRRHKLYSALWRTPVCLIPWDLTELLEGSQVSDDRSSSSGSFLKGKTLEEGLTTHVDLGNMSRFSETSLSQTSDKSKKNSKSLTRAFTSTNRSVLQGGTPREILVRSPEPMPVARPTDAAVNKSNPNPRQPTRSSTAPSPQNQARGRHHIPSPIMTQNISRPILPVPSKSPHTPARASPLRASFTNSSLSGNGNGSSSTITSSRTSLPYAGGLQVPKRNTLYDARSSISRYSTAPSTPNLNGGRISSVPNLQSGRNSSMPNLRNSGRMLEVPDENVGRSIISGGREYYQTRGWNPSLIQVPASETRTQNGQKTSRQSGTGLGGRSANVRPPPTSWGYVT
ncbi:hypothetical protein M422DRAFT_51925 [Sphaerobolus stellatus SS14]|uniref:Unplaced genomic scaffold SPHSTscaffold_122, whole genome shotgun sequence n=1 Tax=Sphaerobolus stellatus (strain SS14) TaxID=990650 RepID=A0A0C9UZG0_SPHS4|nr:hypothetical protein M422DRAFT_51925 [Sphaerobolus stellatus SS14]